MPSQFFFEKQTANALGNAVERSIGFFPQIVEGVQGYYVDVPYAGGKGDIVLDAFISGMIAARDEAARTSRKRERNAAI